MQQIDQQMFLFLTDMSQFKLTSGMMGIQQTYWGLCQQQGMQWCEVTLEKELEGRLADWHVILGQISWALTIIHQTPNLITKTQNMQMVSGCPESWGVYLTFYILKIPLGKMVYQVVPEKKTLDYCLFWGKIGLRFMCNVPKHALSSFFTFSLLGVCLFWPPGCLRIKGR